MEFDIPMSEEHYHPVDDKTAVSRLDGPVGRPKACAA